MKKFLLLIINFFLFINLTYSQNLFKVQDVKEKQIVQLSFNISVQPGIPAASFSESFESTTFPPTGWATHFFGGSGWSRETVGTIPPGWTNGSITTPTDGGNAVAYCTWGEDPTFNDQWLVTPLIQNIQPTDTLYFWLRNHRIDYSDSVYIYYSTDGNNFNPIGQVFYPVGGDTNWGKWFIPIGEVIAAGSNINIGFQEFVSDNQNNGGAISLDLVTISGTTTPTYPSTIQLSKSYTFGDPSKNSSYRLIGLPGLNNLSVTTLFTGNHKTDWNIFYDNGVTSDTISNYLIEFNGSTTFNFMPGRGFWALSRNGVGVSRQVNTVTLTADAFNIPLHDGWNIISNPFEKSVTLAGAVFHSFSGNFTPTNTMVPYEGYYFNNTDNSPSLNIPYPFTSSFPKINEQPYFLSDESLKLKLSSSEFSSEVMIGFDEAASNNYDDMDYFAPPGNFEELGIRLVNNNFSTSYKQLFIEHRTEIGEGQSFELQIKNATNKKANLVINGIEKFSEQEIYLVDERLKKFYNLKTQNQIEISGSHQNNKFSLLIGNQDFIKTYKDNYTPTEFALYQNYPNPFNPTTFIRYQVPEKENVSIRIYDILGNLIKVLVDEIKDEGYYEVQFDGSTLSSGMYIYKFESGSTISIKKMTLLK